MHWISKTIFIFLFSYSSLQGCGIAFIRLNKPLDYYQDRYGTAQWGLQKLMILMDRQRNRGQDSAGIAIAGTEEKTLSTDRDLSLDALLERSVQKSGGVLLLGHVRYSTSGSHDLAQAHPFVHRAESPHQTFAFAGNFNLTNKNALLGGESELSDAFAILKTLAESSKTSPLSVLKEAAPLWDGGYVLCSIYPDGKFFVCRDANGIRPGFYFQNDEVFAVASEKSALIDAFGIDEQAVHPIPPGHAFYLSDSGELKMSPFIDPALEMSCILERIYFSKASDSNIYQERKMLGCQLASRVLKEIGGDLDHAVFTYIPHSSQAAFLGMIEGIEALHRENIKKEWVQKGSFEEIEPLLKQRVRHEMLIHKNQKTRTFISSDAKRSQQIALIYETTQGVVTPADTLIVVDDSIVRGATLKESIIKKLIALNPKKIIIVSSAPPVRFPDCYGIDMSQIGRLIAFQAAVEIFKEKNGHEPTRLSEVYGACSLDEIESKVAQLITPENGCWTGEVKVIFQSMEGLNRAIPSCKGQWVFDGIYPTQGGFKTLQTSFEQWLKREERRSY